jgi:hypothetical protein
MRSSRGERLRRKRKSISLRFAELGVKAKKEKGRGRRIIKSDGPDYSIAKDVSGGQTGTRKEDRCEPEQPTG